MLSDDEGLVIERVVAGFRDQSSDLRLGEEEFVEPRKLRENLEVGEILGGEVAGGALRRIAEAAEALPELAVAGIAADEVGGVGLE